MRPLFRGTKAPSLTLPTRDTGLKAGDLIRHYDADCGTGIVIKASTGNFLDIIILWDDGALEYCDPEVLELVE